MARLVSRLRVIAEGSDEAVALALHDTANFILTLIRVNAPVDTGWLRDSYKKESVTLLHILVGTMVNYAGITGIVTSHFSQRRTSMFAKYTSGYPDRS
jgi:hypothetical protein